MERLLKNEIESMRIVFLSVTRSLKNETEAMRIVFLSMESSLKNETKIWGLNSKP